ncbi:interferon gamma receptor 1 [Trichosurus vulpecula]|uniref:interferon gamma receptor 1 n=1 Tax=Trichosurus vulpecula TaxID=9337 RepID=UPI00186ACD23|nr:interferon gamma receptor 1 [Trichosurus vulpecula]
MRPGLPRASGVGPSLLLLFVFMYRSWAEPPTLEPAASKVSTPINVEIKSYNLNPEVTWDYQKMSQIPTFTVELKNYKEGKWNEVCTNISHRFCNIFYHVKSPLSYYWARVKATVGQKESSFVESKQFFMYQDGKIGPPKLKVQEKNHQLIIDITHPVTVVEGEEKGPVCFYYNDDDDYDDDCGIFTYKVYVKINGSKITEEEPQSCSETQCQLIIPAISFDSEYCVSAEGVSDSSDVWTSIREKSDEQCITTSPNPKREEDSLPILIISVCVALVICIVLITYLVWKREVFQRKNFILPKSLAFVVRNFNSRNILEVNPEPKCISVVETSYLVVPESEEKSIDHLTSVSSINSEDNREKSEHFQETSSITEEMTVEENINEMTSDSHQNTMMKEDYFHPNSSQAESGSLISDSCLPRDDSENRHVESCDFMSDPEPPQSDPETRADIQDNITLRKVNTSYGYDKPHVLVDMLIDADDKESLIGYRPSEPSVEIL